MTDRGASFGECLDALSEYAGALRGDWGSIDGRSEQEALLSLRQELDRAHEHGAASVGVHRLRSTLGVCSQGGAHWVEHCGDLCGGGGRA